MMNDKKITFVAAREDGFGERLRAMLNAMLLAENFNGKFLFNWEERPIWGREHHSVVSKEETFSADFIDKFYIDKTQLQKMKFGYINNKSQNNWFEEERIKNSDAILVSQHLLSGLQKPAADDIDFINGYKRNFEKIEFSKSLEHAKAYASNIKLKEHSIAIHLRAGDLIYGGSRFHNSIFMEKIAPFPIAIGLIKFLKENNFTPIVFGQDKELLEYLKSEFEVTLSLELSDLSFSVAQQAFFDVVLMSKCEQIFTATDSGFSTLASWISGGEKTKDIYKAFSKEETLIFFESFFKILQQDNNISLLQKAFACWAYIKISGDGLATNEKMRYFLNLAIEYDPENDFYHLVKACSFYKEGKIDDAEEILYQRFCAADKRSLSIVQILNKTFPKISNKTIGYLYLENLKYYANVAYPMAALCAAIIEKAVGNDDLFLHFKKLFMVNDGAKYVDFHKYIT
ncbi:MAG: hypothetical protein LBS26_01080 [Campylobacteraceae bacterium]|jgi:hypothetical protein|nr:hypothetical protein [Campylobacteraceae bacterium]